MTTPTISNVSGTIATGQILSITGTNMMDEDKTNWDSFFTLHPNAYGFEGSSPADDFYCDLGPCYGIYDNTVKLMGTKSIKWHVEGASTNCPYDNLASYNAINPSLSDGDAGDLWIRFYFRYNLTGNSPTGNIKLIDTQGHNGEQYYFAPYATLDNPFKYLNPSYAEGGSNKSHPIPWPGGYANNKWWVVELHWKTTPPHIFDVWFDNQLIYTASPPDPIYTVEYVLIGMITVCGTTSEFSLDNWMDGFTISSSRIYPSSTIEIANSSNYSTATKKYQEPVYLSDGSVQIKADLTDLGSGPYYLFVTNNRQETSSPYFLNSTCPSVECSFQLDII